MADDAWCMSRRDRRAIFSGLLPPRALDLFFISVSWLLCLPLLLHPPLLQLGVSCCGVPQPSQPPRRRACCASQNAIPRLVDQNLLPLPNPFFFEILTALQTVLKERG